MSSCEIYELFKKEDIKNNRHGIAQTKKKVDVISNKHNMSSWLKTKGDKNKTYELLSGASTVTRWCWKEKKNKWGRMATPPKRDVDHILE